MSGILTLSAGQHLEGFRLIIRPRRLYRLRKLDTSILEVPHAVVVLEQAPSYEPDTRSLASSVDKCLAQICTSCVCADNCLPIREWTNVQFPRRNRISSPAKDKRDGGFDLLQLRTRCRKDSKVVDKQDLVRYQAVYLLCYRICWSDEIGRSGVHNCTSRHVGLVAIHNNVCEIGDVIADDVKGKITVGGYGVQGSYRFGGIVSAQGQLRMAYVDRREVEPIHCFAHFVGIDEALNIRDAAGTDLQNSDRIRRRMDPAQIGRIGGRLH